MPLTSRIRLPTTGPIQPSTSSQVRVSTPPSFELTGPSTFTFGFNRCLLLQHTGLSRTARIPPPPATQKGDDFSDTASMFQHMSLTAETSIRAGMLRLTFGFDDIVSLLLGKGTSINIDPMLTSNESISIGPRHSAPIHPQPIPVSTTSSTPASAPVNTGQEWVMSAVRTLRIVMDGDAAVGHAGTTGENDIRAGARLIRAATGSLTARCYRLDTLALLAGTADSGTIAGFKVSRIFNVPTAAAIASGLDEKGTDETTVVLLRGGRTREHALFALTLGLSQLLVTFKMEPCT
ncbi:hypothetical protein CF319_g4496 [Tilletia indica]|nr:hypothetical protein CF319_g4496 [Tilletia indica]